MARMSNAALQEELDRLAGENAALREELHTARSMAQTLPLPPFDGAVSAPQHGHGRRSRWWTALSVFLIVVGLVLAPVAAAGAWARTQLTDTDAFVATFAPLADDPAVQAFISDQVVAAIDEQVDIDGLTNSLFDGIEELGLGPAATKALNALRAPAVAGIQSLVDRVVTRFVTSDAFSDVWAQALRVSHTQLLATLHGDEDAAVTIGGNGEIGVQLAPIIDAVKTALVKNGVAFAANIPTVQKTVVVATSDAAVLVQVLYGVAVTVGIWLPWVALAFLVAGVLVARKRIVALLGASIGLGLVMIAVAAGVSIGRLVFITLTSSSAIPADAASVIYLGLTAQLSSIAVAVAVLAITVAVVSWLASRYRVPSALRSIVGGWFARLRGLGEERGVTTGRFGAWLYAQRVVVRVLIAIAASVIVLFVRPLTPGLIIWTAVIAILIIGVAELLARPAALESEADRSQDTPAALV